MPAASTARAIKTLRVFLRAELEGAGQSRPGAWPPNTEDAPGGTAGSTTYCAPTA
jgi:hypothetical protein